MKRVKSYQLKPMNILRLLVLIALTVTTIVPFLVLILVSLKTQNDFMINPLGIPEQWNFGNYVTVFVKAHVGQAFFNSVKITSVSVVLQIIFGSMVGYALIKMNFKHANKFASLFLLPMVFPIQTILIPIYIIFRKVGLLNSSVGLIILYVATGLPLVIFIMTGFMKTIPVQISESAFVEGAGHFTIFFKLILPLLKPVIASVIVVSGLSIWNDFFMPLIMISKKENKTLPLIIHHFMGQYSTDWTLICTSIVFITFPIIVVYYILQRHIISGAIAGAVKG